MLIQHLPLLCTKRIVLASASPRQSEFLRGLVSFAPVFDVLEGEDVFGRSRCFFIRFRG